jgi:hypothetical protein
LSCSSVRGAGCLEGFDDQCDSRGASVALDLDSGGIALEHNDDHLVAEPVADPANPQLSASGLGQPRAAMGTEDGVGNLERSWSPNAKHRDGAAAFGRQTAHERSGVTRIASRGSRSNLADAPFHQHVDPWCRRPPRLRF